jgi:tetratricopeptide (TPR) repeat protein
MQANPSPEQRGRYAQAVDALNRGEWERAEALASALQRELPPHGGLHFVAGVAALHRHRAGQAAELLRRAVTLTPGRADYLAQWARALATVYRFEEALEVAEAALRLVPGDAMSCDALGFVFSQSNAHAKAVAMYRRAVALEPSHPPYRFNLGASLLFTGELDAAERELEACLRLAPTFWKAWLALSQLRRQTRDSNHVDRLRALVDQAAANPDAQLYLQLALAKELDDLGETAPAFAALVAGKAAGRSRRPYVPSRDESLFAALSALPGASDAAPPGHPSDAPIFVFGMPRSGTTLVERILSRHPDVSSAGELPDFGVALKRASGSTTPPVIDPDTVERSSDLDWHALGAAYLASVGSRRGDAPRFVDKLPHNFLYAGHIARALPNARMICVRRDPVDTCLSNFRQLFAVDSARFDYSYDLLDTGRYYLLFDRLVAHWNRLFPGRILEVAYEDLVDRQEEATRRLLAFCGLPWDAACLRFEENDAPVATASAVQVRSSLYRSALGRWKRYAPYLADLLALLDEGGVLTHAESPP